MKLFCCWVEIYLTPVSWSLQDVILLAMGARAVLLKGGHLPGDDLMDLLVQPNTPL